MKTHRAIRLIKPYLYATLLSLVAVAVTRLLLPYTVAPVYHVILGFVLLASIWLGYGSGLITLGLTSLLGLVFVVQWRSGVSDALLWGDLRRWILSVLLGGLLVAVAGRARQLAVVARQARDELRESQELLKNLIEGTPALIGVQNAQGKNLLVNTAMAKAFNLTPEQALKVNQHDVFPKEQAEMVAAEHRRVIETGISTQLEETVDIGGQRRHFFVVRSPLHDASGKVQGVTVVINEITELRRAEQQRDELKVQLVLSSKLADLGLLSAGVAHEVNNPLAIIKGNSEMLRDAMVEGDPVDTQLKALERIDKAVARISDIVQGLSNYARTAQEEPGCVDMHSVIQDTLSLCAVTYQQAGINIEAQLLAPRPWFRGQPGKLQQILMNLLSNARDAMEGRPGKVSIGTENQQEELVLRISDQGCGIAAENISKIFTPFFTTKPPGRGTGLGLSLVQSMVASFGGSIAVASELGRGATFTVRIPSDRSGLLHQP